MREHLKPLAARVPGPRRQGLQASRSGCALREQDLLRLLHLKILDPPLFQNVNISGGSRGGAAGAPPPSPPPKKKKTTG